VPRKLSIILAILVTFFVLTSAVPDVLVIVLVFTFGLGFPLLFLNTVLLYLLVALPTLLLLRRRPRPWAAIALAASAVPVVALIPPLLSESAASRKMEELRAGDKEGRLASTPKSVEIAGDLVVYGGRNDPLTHAPCDALCQRLLLSRRVDLVRMTRMRQNSSVPRSQMDYVIEHRDNCPNAFGEGDTMLPQTRDAVVTGTCFVPRAPDAARPEARIVIRNTRSPAPANLIQDLAAANGAVNETQVLEISVLDAGAWSLELRQTQVKFSHWSMPLHLWYARCYGMCIGRPVFGRSERTLNPFDPTERTLHALRVDTGDPPDRLSPAARVMAVLDQAGEVLTDNQVDLINDWTKNVACRYGNCPPLSGLDEEVTMRLVKDRRVTNFVLIGSVIGRNRRLVADNFDVFLDEMEARGANSQFSNTIGATVAQLDNDVLRSRSDRILTLARDNEWTWSRGIGIASGRLGVDTTSLISERLGRATSAATAALAACLADDPIGRALVPNLLAYLRALPVSQLFPPKAAQDAVKALARFGHFDEAKDVFLSRFPKTGEHSLPRQSAAAVPRDVNACYRG
jgi:hypothetical protein